LSVFQCQFGGCIITSKLWYTNMIEEQLYEDTDVRVIDQRIGMGIGGLNTVIRLYHKPTGILIEIPRLTRNQYYDKQLAFEMLEYALASDLEVGSDE